MIYKSICVYPMETLKEGQSYSIEWVDGYFKTKCVFVREHRGFWIFKDNSGMKVFCRPNSIREIILLKD